MKVYGSHICIGLPQLPGPAGPARLCGGIQSTSPPTPPISRNFLALRDHDPVFVPVREHGGIGIPLFVNEDGRKTFDVDEALGWIGQPPVQPEEVAEQRPACGAAAAIDFGISDKDTLVDFGENSKISGRHLTNAAGSGTLPDNSTGLHPLKQ